MSPSTQDTHAERGRGQGNELVAVSVHGERVGTRDELEQLPVERLAEVMLELDEYTKRMRATRKLIVAERERRLVEQCRTWKRSVSGVEVVRAIPLLPEQSEDA
jgi:hypothetical protein